jgi:Dna[CI] antecedent, DciA
VRRIGEDVGRELGRFGVAAGMPELVRAWPEAVGSAIAASAWPARIARDGTLHVHTVDSTWAFELGTRAAEIASRLGVTGVRFVPGPLPERSVTDVEKQQNARVNVEDHDREEGARLAAPIGDEKLRKMVARAAAASLARGRDSRSL